MTENVFHQRRRVLLAVFTLVVIIMSAGVLYYVFTLNAAVTGLQKSVADLQSKNAQLEQKLLALKPLQNGNVSLFGLNPMRIYAATNRSVLTVQGAKSTIVNTLFGQQTVTETIMGSGFIIQYSNVHYVVTNFHVVDGTANTVVTFWNGDTYSAKVVGYDAYSDLALLSVQAPGGEFYPLVLASSSLLLVGEPVVAIGNPFGLSGSITFGIVSQLGRSLQYESTTGNFPIADVIQFSAPINPGNSGGPLLNSNGMVVGITAATVTGAQGVGFAIPSDTIIREIAALVNTGGYNKHPFLGISWVDMNPQLAQAMNTNVSSGVLIETVTQDSPASKAGLKGGSQKVEIFGTQFIIGGDIILSINGTKIMNGDAFSTYLERNTIPGQIIQVGIYRSGSYTTVTVELGTRAPPK